MPAQRARLDRAQIDHIAKLAALSLSDAEAHALASELDAILRHVEQLDSLDTTDVPPTTDLLAGSAGAGPGLPAGSGWREDRVLPGVSHDDALAAAPRSSLGGFAVPTFVDANATAPAAAPKRHA